MFAVIRASGRQYKVAANDVIEINRIETAVGDRVDFGEVLMLGGPDGTQLGGPFVTGALVAGEVLDHPRAKKVIAFKKRRRHNYKRKHGHRQHLTLVRITDILTDGRQPAPRQARAEPTVAVAAGSGDDLKLLVGVGPVIEKKLNELGITTFAQVAALTPAEIDRIDDALHFKGRVEREGWVAQAAALAKGEKKD